LGYNPHVDSLRERIQRLLVVSRMQIPRPWRRQSPKPKWPSDIWGGTQFCPRACANAWPQTLWLLSRRARSDRKN